MRIEKTSKNLCADIRSNIKPSHEIDIIFMYIIFLIYSILARYPYNYIC